MIKVMCLLFIGFIYSYVANADSALNKGIKAQAKETLLNSITSDKKEEKSLLKSNYYFSYGYSKRKAPVITVSSAGEVVYEDPTFHRVSFLKHMEDWSLGISVDYDDETKDVSSIVGHFGGKDWFVVVEKATLSGRIDISGGDSIEFKDNNYFDVKFLKYFNEQQQLKMKNKTPVALGVQYYTYERASVVNKEKTTYYDPKSDVKYLGIVFENDSVKYKLTHNIAMPKHSWYFYNTTSFGIGNVKLSDSTVLSTKVASKPSDDTFWGPGMIGEYELGYVYSYKVGSIQGALKIGYNVQMENPYISLTDPEDSDINPAETFFTHGPQITLIGVF